MAKADRTPAAGRRRGTGRTRARRNLGCLAVAAFASAAPPALAQPEQRNCKPLAPPFAANDANQLKKPALGERVTGKTLVFKRPTVRAGVTALFRFEFRRDGTVVMTCRARRGEAAGRPCRGFGPGTSGRDVGVWRVDDDQIAIKRTRFAELESRITLHTQGSRLAVRRVAGAHCLPGPVTLE